MIWEWTRRVLAALALLAGSAWAAPAPAARGGGSIRLEELDLARMTSGWQRPRAGKAVGGSEMRLGAKVYAHGVGTHAPSRFAVALDGRASRFSAVVGLDEEVGDGGSIEFQVLGDGRLLWTSGKVTGRDAPRPVEVKLAGIRNLTLVVTDGGDGINNDHADWADGRLEFAGRPPLAQYAVADAPAPIVPNWYQKKVTWQETLRAAREAVDRFEAEELARLAEARRSDEKLKRFRAFDGEIVYGQKPRTVRVRVSGLMTMFLRAERADEKGRRSGYVYFVDARLLDANGAATPLEPRRPLLAGRYGTQRVGEERNGFELGGEEFEKGMYIQYDERGVEAEFALAGTYEWFEATVGMRDNRNRDGDRARLVVDALPVIAVRDKYQSERDRIESLACADFADGPATREQMLERRDGIWREAWKPGDVAALAARYARACRDADLRDAAWRRAKLARIPADLQAVRDLYYVGHGRERLDLARRTLAFVERSEPRPELARELADANQALDALDLDAHTDGQALHGRICRLRRRIILSHPLLDFEKLLINKRPPPNYSHMCDQYLGRHSRSGPGLVVLTNWKDRPQETKLLAGKLPVGSVLHPELSYDARRVVFSYCDHTVTNKQLRRFFVWETGIDGEGLRQITGTALDPLTGWGGRHTVLIEDLDPVYLPDGDIVFISTRNQTFGRCHGGRYTPVYMLFRMNADGSDIHQISFGEANEWDPGVLADGQVVYCRWDYINRHDTIFQSLWTTHPDGRATAHFYGNYSRAPCMITEARAVPESNKVVATATAHHGYTTGTTVLVDTDRGRDGLDPLTRITPEFAFPEAPDRGSFVPGAAATPFPLSEDLFLVAYMTEPRVGQGRVQSANAYAIYLVDTLGGRELIYRDPTTSCFTPIPIQPRSRPPVLPSLSADERHEAATGTLFLRDVYECTQPLAPGSITHLRVNAILGQPTASHPRRSLAANEIVKRILGTVPVAKNGSALFRVPARQPVQLQALDANGMAVMTMRSLVYVQPGEFIGCVGCHEPREATSAVLTVPADMTARDIDPPAGPRYPGGFSFARTVQPVLDRRCIGCHGLDPNKVDEKLKLLGTPQDGFSTAYCSLTADRKRVRIAHRNGETYFSKPMDYFAHAGTLAGFLMGRHRPKAALDRDGLQRIIDWLDVNAQFYGDYSRNRDEDRRIDPAAEKALREHVRKTFGPELASQPFAALVNVALPAESRILKAPLAVKAGGWGQVGGGAWKSTDDAGYRQMRKLVEACIVPNEFHDIEGTCGRERGCRCGSCWVRKAEKEYKDLLAAKEAHAAAPRKASP